MTWVVMDLKDDYDEDYWQRRYENLYNYKARVELVEMVVELEKKNKELRDDTNNT